MPATTPRPPSSEQVAAFDRNAWPRSIGIPGRNRRNPQATAWPCGSGRNSAGTASETVLSLPGSAMVKVELVGLLDGRPLLPAM
jgi:hypothetical protein